MTSIKDMKYYEELKDEIKVKENQFRFLLNQIELLRSNLAFVEKGYTKKDLKELLEHNPFDDYDFFGIKKSWDKIGRKE
jgi:hypothetical protein